jgi:hypothetical protein
LMLWFGNGTATGGVYSGTGWLMVKTEKLIPLILLRLVSNSYNNLYF